MYPESERKVFSYFNGSATIFADPMAIKRRIAHATKGQESQILADCKSDLEPVAFAAWEKFLAATREAFEMVPFNPVDGTGSTEEDCIDAWNAFVDYRVKKKRNVGPSLTCSPLSEPASSPAASDTKSGSAST